MASFSKGGDGDSLDMVGIRNRRARAGSADPASRQRVVTLDPRRSRYPQNTADASDCSTLDLVMSRHRRLGKVGRIEPDIVLGAMMV